MATVNRERGAKKVLAERRDSAGKSGVKEVE